MSKEIELTYEDGREDERKHIVEYLRRWYYNDLVVRKIADELEQKRDG